MNINLGVLVQLCINPLKETELILYGGEFYNGNKVLNIVFDCYLSIYVSRSVDEMCLVWN